MSRKPLFVGLSLVAGLVLFGVILAKTAPTSYEVPINELIDKAESGSVIYVMFENRRIVAEVKPTTPKEPKEVSSFARYPKDKTELMRVLDEKKVPYTEAEPSAFWPVLISMLPIIVMVGIVFMMRRGFAKQTEPANSKAKPQSEIPPTTFNDVAGADEAVAEARGPVEFLKNPSKYAKIGAKMPSGCLLIGPPGTGKTLLARAIAGEAGVPFFFKAGSAFVETYVGVGASRVRNLFAEAKKRAPCIVFIDELDAIAKKRGGFSNGEYEHTLNQLLVEMDGFEPNAGVFVIAATNRPEVLDPAVLRPGRFTRHIAVPAPDIRGREKILRVHAKNKPLAPDVDLHALARGTPGMTGADLENVLNEAAIFAADAGKSVIELRDITAACEKVRGGAERSMVLSDRVKRVIAYHEAGHTLAGYFTAWHDPTNKVTIIPRGMSLGSTWYLPEEDQHLLTKEQLLGKIVGLYGGRAAEEIAFGPEHVTTGAGNDLERATELAHTMVEKYGMGDKFGPPRVYGGRESGTMFGASAQDYSQDTRRKIECQIDTILRQCYERAKDILKTRKPKLDEMAARLIEQETLDRAEIEAMLGPRPATDDPEPA